MKSTAKEDAKCRGNKKTGGSTAAALGASTRIASTTASATSGVFDPVLEVDETDAQHHAKQSDCQRSVFRTEYTGQQPNEHNGKSND